MCTLVLIAFHEAQSNLLCLVLVFKWNIVPCLLLLLNSLGSLIYFLQLDFEFLAHRHCYAMTLVLSIYLLIRCFMRSQSYKTYWIGLSFVREKVASWTLVTSFVSSTHQLVDIFTKALPKETFQSLPFKLGVMIPPSSLRGSDIEGLKSDGSGPPKPNSWRCKYKWNSSDSMIRQGKSTKIGSLSSWNGKVEWEKEWNPYGSSLGFCTSFCINITAYISLYKF